MNHETLLLEKEETQGETSYNHPCFKPTHTTPTSPITMKPFPPRPFYSTHICIHLFPWCISSLLYPLFVYMCTLRLFFTSNVALLSFILGNWSGPKKQRRNPPRGKGRKIKRSRQGTKYVGVNRMGGGACWAGGRSENEMIRNIIFCKKITIP